MKLSTRFRWNCLECSAWLEAGEGARSACLERFAHDYFAFTDEELGRTILRAADDRHQTIDLPARDQAQHTAGRAGQHGPIGIFLLADFAGVLENKNCSGLHLFGNPFVQNVQFSDHALLLYSTSKTRFRSTISSCKLGRKLCRELLRSFSSTPTTCRRCYGGTRFAGDRSEERR